MPLARERCIRCFAERPFEKAALGRETIARSLEHRVVLATILHAGIRLIFLRVNLTGACKRWLDRHRGRTSPLQGDYRLHYAYQCLVLSRSLFSGNSGTSSGLIARRARINSTFHALRNHCINVDRSSSLGGFCRADGTCERYRCAPIVHTWCFLQICPRDFHRGVRAITKIETN
jgi:hypothetical protein